MPRLAPIAQKILAVPIVYRTWGWVIGGVPGRERFAREHIRAKAGDRVLDIGCGPADILSHLPAVAYTGFDGNPEYIENAKRTHGDRGTFYCKLVSEESLAGGEKFDIVLAIGVVHHLEDAEAEHLHRLAHGALVPGGRLITVDPVFVDGQSRIARFLISRDRGEHVRNEDAYVALARRVFSKVTPVVRHDTLRIPYTNLVLECER